MRKKNQGDWQENNDPIDNPENLEVNEKISSYYSDGKNTEEDYQWRKPRNPIHDDEDFEDAQKSWRSSEVLYQRAYESRRKSEATEDEFFYKSKRHNKTLILRAVITLALAVVIAVLIWSIFSQLDRREAIQSQLLSSSKSSQKASDNSDKSTSSQSAVNSSSDNTSNSVGQTTTTLEEASKASSIDPSETYKIDIVGNWVDRFPRETTIEESTTSSQPE